jgi:hypothetical protein
MRRPVEDRDVDIDFAASWPAPPGTVFGLFTDGTFLRERGNALGAEVQEVTVAGSETAVRLGIPTAVIPPVFARFVAGAVSFLERTTWTPDGDGRYRATLDARAAVLGRAVEISGERRLSPDDTGTRSTVTADVSVQVPLIGGRAAAAVRQLVQLVLRREDELVRRRLAQR